MRHIIFILLTSVCVNAQTVSTDISNSMASGNYEHSIELLLQQPNLYSSAILLDKLGESYAYQQEWDKAIETYKRLTSLVKDDPNYFFKYGGVLAKKAQNSNPFIGLTLLGRIKSSFNKTLDLDPNHTGAHWALIDLYVSLPGIVGGSYSKAYELAAELKNSSPIDGYFAMGYVYEYDDEPVKAKSSYFQALALVREDKEFKRNQLNYQLGKVCSDYGVQLDKGIEYMTRYIANFSIKDGVPLEWAFYRMALLYRKKGNKQKSLFWINKTLQERADFKRAQEEKQLIQGLKG
ncbi:tetratricopeptide repeat protein [uncultured Eudoraea sp.]|uniref:tetratricopeptide repeat protein n=1 Tax=uncultured Eudoraea sp. TaxID=1035614 RepID=UPI0026253BC7|nr:tetratricopeptide repeat protein [uncultured Eudoraea sp.]